MEKQSKKQHQIKIELDDNIGQGEYVNLAIVTHSPAEFVMDYILLVLKRNAFWQYLLHGDRLCV